MDKKLILLMGIVCLPVDVIQGSNIEDKQGLKWESRICLPATMKQSKNFFENILPGIFKESNSFPSIIQKIFPYQKELKEMQQILAMTEKLRYIDDDSISICTAVEILSNDACTKEGKEDAKAVLKTGVSELAEIAEETLEVFWKENLSLQRAFLEVLDPQDPRVKKIIDEELPLTKETLFNVLKKIYSRSSNEDSLEELKKQYEEDAGF